MLAVALAAVALSAYAATDRLFPGDIRMARELQDTPGGGGLARAANALYFARYPLMALAAVYAALRRRPDVLLAAVFVLLALTLNPVIKDVIERARPTAADGVVIREHASGFGYPSGHAMSIALLSGYAAVAGWRLLARTAAIAGVLVEAVTIVLVGWMRVYNGAHWPSDVVGGWMIGLALLAISFAAAGRVAGRRRDGSSLARPRAPSRTR